MKCTRLDALRTVRDPEIPVNIVELGLIYELTVKQGGIVYVEMTLTTPACPVAPSSHQHATQTGLHSPVRVTSLSRS